VAPAVVSFWLDYLDLSLQVLRKLVADSAKFLNDKVEKAVITVPAYFNDSQRQVCVVSSFSLPASSNASFKQQCQSLANSKPPQPFTVWGHMSEQHASQLATGHCSMSRTTACQDNSINSARRHLYHAYVSCLQPGQRCLQPGQCCLQPGQR
jgi:hypothetical protein